AQAHERHQDALTHLEQIEQSDTTPPKHSTEELEQQYLTAQQHHSHLETTRDAHREQVHELGRTNAGLIATSPALVMATAAQTPGQHLATSTVGRIPEHVRVTQGYQTAVSAALGIFNEALLVSEESDALAVIAQAREGELGRLGVIIANSQPQPGPKVS